MISAGSSGNAPSEPGTQGTPALRIASLADTACLSPSQFKVVFKQQLGCLPNDYITQRRMQKALGLILNTDLPLTIIAEQCGYRSVPAFIRRFRTTYNQTPNKMRIKP